MLKGKMMFYHVLVETNEKDKNGNNRQYHQLDIDDKEKVLEKSIPTMNNENFMIGINGYLFF